MLSLDPTLSSFALDWLRQELLVWSLYLICGFIIVSLTCTLTVFRDRDIDDVLVALA